MPPPSTNPPNRLGPGERQLGRGGAPSTTTWVPKCEGHELTRSGDRWRVRCTLTFDSASKAEAHLTGNPGTEADFLERKWTGLPLSDVTPGDGVRTRRFRHFSAQESPTETVWNHSGGGVSGINLKTSGHYDTTSFEEYLALRQFSSPITERVKGRSVIREYDCELWSGFIFGDQANDRVEDGSQSSDSDVNPSPSDQYESSEDEGEAGDGDYKPR